MPALLSPHPRWLEEFSSHCLLQPTTATSSAASSPSLDRRFCLSSLVIVVVARHLWLRARERLPSNQSSISLVVTVFVGLRTTRLIQHPDILSDIDVCSYLCRIVTTNGSCWLLLLGAMSWFGAYIDEEAPANARSGMEISVAREKSSLAQKEELTVASHFNNNHV